MAYWGFVVSSAISFVFALSGLKGHSASARIYRTEDLIRGRVDFERWENASGKMKRWPLGSLLRSSLWSSLWGTGAWVIYQYCTSPWDLVITIPLGLPGGVALAFAWRSLANCFSGY